MKEQRFSAAANGERRLLFKWERASGFWEHLKNFGEDFKHTYIDEGMGRKGVLDKMTAAIAGAMQIILRGGEAVYDGAIGKKFEAPHGLAGNTVRDVKTLGKDLLHLRPLHVLGGVWKLATSSIPQDIGDTVAGLRLGSQRHATREHIASALTPSGPSHSIASIAARTKSRALAHESPPVLAA